MCFSAEASFTAGAVLLVIGAVTVRQARSRREMPYALIPLLFALQQLLEGALWLTFPDRAPALNAWLTQGYSLFSHVLWPIYVPLAALAMEDHPLRRRILIGVISVFKETSTKVLDGCRPRPSRPVSWHPFSE